MKKAFALSITLWISAILLAISAYFIYVTKKELNNDVLLMEKLKDFLKTKSTLEDVKYYLGSGRYTYNYVSNSLSKYPAKMRIDSYPLELNGTKIILQDVGGLINTVYFTPDMVDRMVNDYNKTLNSQTAANSFYDWLDSDSIPRENGAEASWYLTNGYAYAPRNSVIVTKEELKDIREWNSLYDHYKNIFTFQPSVNINFTAMSAEVLHVKYNIPLSEAKSLVQLKNRNINLFLDKFYKTPKNGYDYESDTYFSSKIIKIKVITVSKNAKYSITQTVNFKNFNIEYNNF